MLEYEEEKFIAVAWDNNKYIFIDNKAESITHILSHPLTDKTNLRCWGLAKVGEYDFE